MTASGNKQTHICIYKTQLMFSNGVLVPFLIKVDIQAISNTMKFSKTRLITYDLKL